jgi:hypothetical protein
MTVIENDGKSKGPKIPRYDDDIVKKYDISRYKIFDLSPIDMID